MSKTYPLFVQKVANAYVTLLTGLTKRIQNTVRLGTGGYQFLESPIGLKQLEENIQQFQETVQEFAKQINGLLTRGGPTNGNVALTQFNKFVTLWQKQIREVTSQLNRAFGGGSLRDTSSTVKILLNLIIIT